MPSCKNGKGSYKGTEPSPKGRGFCARHEKAGTKKRGTDKKLWVVRSVNHSNGKRFKRWFRVVSKKPTKKKRKTIKKKLHGGGGLRVDPTDNADEFAFEYIKMIIPYHLNVVKKHDVTKNLRWIEAIKKVNKKQLEKFGEDMALKIDNARLLAMRTAKHAENDRSPYGGAPIDIDSIVKNSIKEKMHPGI